MTKSEFSDWFDYHCGCFPGLRTWRGKMSAAEQKGVVDAWYRLLRPCELGDAKAATDYLFRSADGAPRVYERHPSAVREVAQAKYEQRIYAKPEVQFVDGEQVYRCIQCQDDGRVICWSQKSMAAAREGMLGEPFTVYTCAVACDCQLGEYYARHLGRFDPQKWLICGPAPHREELERLRQFVEVMEEVAS